MSVQRSLRAIIIGNPNSGKTTLFNDLTGDHQAVGNWSGVTVDKKSGVFHDQSTTIHITDLPGVYSLTRSQEDLHTDTHITSNEIVSSHFDIIINVIDACHLERHLYLTTQILELNKPVIVVLSMLDVAKKRGIQIDEKILAQQLGCPVIKLDDKTQDLRSILVNSTIKNSGNLVKLNENLNQYLTNIEKIWINNNGDINLAPYVARRVVEGDALLMQNYFQPEENMFDLEIADARYNKIHQIVLLSQKKISDRREHVTSIVDRVVLHRILGIPIFFAVMYLMFFFAIHIGGALQDLFDVATNYIFVEGTAKVLNILHAQKWLVALCANGIGQGIHTTLTFVPVIALMFLALSWLEASGYMARAAFIMDRAMYFLGLPGKAFVPLIMGFGCNVPAILATRTLQSDYDRKLTMMMTPFMSCSARLAIYSVFVAAFFPTNGHNVVFSLYLLGISMAIVTGILLRKTLLKGKTSSLIIELPAYHLPTWTRLVNDMWRKLRLFIWRAGKLIIPVSLVLGGLNACYIHTSSGETISILAVVGQFITPIFSPMGISQDNWPATVSLLTGMLAKEVVIGSLNSLYMQMNHLPNLELMPNVMQQHFVSQASAYAYLVFILLYIPCVSTMAAIRQESNRTFMWFSMLWSLFVAYFTAIICYQCATFIKHPFMNMVGLVVVLILIRFSYNYFKRQSVIL